MPAWGRFKRNTPKKGRCPMQRVVSVEVLSQSPFDSKTPICDGHIVHHHMGIFGVIGGSSAARSPDHPPLTYNGGMLGGQLAALRAMFVLGHIAPTVTLGDYLLRVNQYVAYDHAGLRCDPIRDDVGGAGFAFCKPTPEGLEVIVAADC